MANVNNALSAVWANRTRSVLTMLAIFIGVAAVVAVFILTQGVSQYVLSQVESQGATSITISSGSSSSRGVVSKSSGRSLTFTDYQAISHLSHISDSSLIVSGGGGQIIYGNKNYNARASGVSVSYQQIASWDMARGTWFTQSDNDGAKAVMVIGDTLVQNLFGSTNPIGQTVTFHSQPYRIIGTLAAKGGMNQDSVIFLPVNTARYRLSKSPQSVDSIIVQADSTDNISLVQESITLALERTHHIAKGSPDDFSITSATQLLETAQQEVSAMTALLVGIAAISLTVGGIGVMNIMIVSVTERTREIGVRMSIGARRSDIRTQFLIEALVLCLFGGALGIFVGLGGGFGLTSAFSLPFVLTATTFLMPLTISTLVGLIFGIIPAIRASRLDPIMALRRAK
jgi:putative ABC transport system permease protein